MHILAAGAKPFRYIHIYIYMYSIYIYSLFSIPYWLFPIALRRRFARPHPPLGRHVSMDAAPSSALPWRPGGP